MVYIRSNDSDAAEGTQIKQLFHWETYKEEFCVKLKNQVIKQFALDQNLRSKNELYANYHEADNNKVRYVMVDINDIVICNLDDISAYENAGFSIFGKAESEDELNELIKVAEVS